MRTRLTLEPAAFRAAKAKATHENISLGRAVSALILQAIRTDPTPSRRGARKPAAVFRSPGGIYSAATVEAALDDE